MNRRIVIGGGIAAGLAGVASAPYLFRSRDPAPDGSRLPVLAPEDGRIVARSHATARTVSGAYNLRTRLVPDLRAFCRTPAAVSTMVSWARDNEVPFAIRSGGHCFAGLSQSEGLVIDLREMNAVTVDTGARRAVAGAGAKAGALHAAAAARGLRASAGVCADVAVGGQVLGGGGGYFVRSGGLLCDRLSALTLVDAGGRVLQVSAEENEDLFWAHRGGGGGFGVVTDLTFELDRLERLDHISVHRSLEKSEAAGLLHDWFGWSPAQDQSISTHLRLVNYGRGNMLVSLTGHSTAGRRATLAALNALSQGRLVSIENGLHSGDIPKVMEAALSQSKTPDYYQFTASDLFREGPDTDACASFVETMASGPVGVVSAEFEPLDGAPADLPADATAFPHRGAKYLVLYACTLNTVFETETRLAALDAVRAEGRKHATGDAYANYRDDRLEGWAQAYWGENLPRLRDIKRRRDPDNLFRHAQSVVA